MGVNWGREVGSLRLLSLLVIARLCSARAMWARMACSSSLWVYEGGVGLRLPSPGFGACIEVFRSLPWVVDPSWVVLGGS